MGRIFYIMGKSSSGKDTIYKLLLDTFKNFKTIVLYTTRPIREGETNGMEYFFVGEEETEDLKNNGKIIELREYHTVHGVWKYYTVDDEQINLADDNYLMIGTLESYQKMKEYYGEQFLVPLYIEVEDGERLIRAVLREREQEQPRYSELCRRFLADSEDFSEEKIRAAGIRNRFCNTQMQTCLNELKEYIKSEIV